MRRNVIFQIVALILLCLTLLFYNSAYKHLASYTELVERHYKVLSQFLAISKQVNNAAILNPELVTAINFQKPELLFFTDSNSITRQLTQLNETVKDSINIKIAERLSILVKAEIGWLIKNNLPDSIIHNRSIAHINSFQQINTLFEKGIQRTNYLIGYRTTLLHDEIKKVRAWMIVFSILSGVLLAYTMFDLSRQRNRTKQKEQELEIVLNRINDGVVSVDNNWCYTFLNDAALLTHPFGKKETIGKSIWDIHPEMEGTVFWAKYHEAKDTGVVTETEAYYAPMDTWFSVKAYPSVDGLTIFYKNISESKRLGEQQSLMASIVNSSDDGIISKTLDGIITSWNKGAEKILGYTAEEVIGKHISLIIPVELQHEEVNIIKKISQGENVEHYETRRLKKNGQSLHVALSISPVKDANGTITGASKIVRDITDKKQAEENLIASEMRFRSLIENSAEGISLTDAASNSIYRSPAAIKIMGQIPTENTINRTHPEDTLKMKSIQTNILSNPGLPVPFETRFLHADGNYVWLEGVVTNLLHTEAVKAIVTNFRDITDRKSAAEKLIRSEKIYKTIASSIPGSVICLLDADYRYLLIEGDMLEKLGYSKDTLLGNKAADVLPKDIHDEIAPLFARVFCGETVARESKVRECNVISRYIPLKDEKNVVYAIMTVTIDITALKKAQNDVLQLNANLEKKIELRTEQLKKSNEELEAFSYSVSHDLRSPLRSIIGFSAILEEDYGNKLDEEAKRITGIIKNNTLKMATLIDDLLAFSRSGKQPLAKTIIDTGELVKEVQQQLLQEQEKYSSIKWQLHSLPEVYADLNTFRQVWVNLLSNAAKYSSTRQQPVIEIGSWKEEAYIVFFVKDNGVGFDEAYKDKLFKVFQRLHDQHEFEGTGVGLALVDKIVSRHNGKVWAEGKENEGAAFYFSLPL
jgi:PAS domain S-box-containing protein